MYVDYRSEADELVKRNGFYRVKKPLFTNGKGGGGYLEKGTIVRISVFSVSVYGDGDRTVELRVFPSFKKADFPYLYFEDNSVWVTIHARSLKPGEYERPILLFAPNMITLKETDVDCKHGNEWLDYWFEPADDVNEIEKEFESATGRVKRRIDTACVAPMRIGVIAMGVSIVLWVLTRCPLIGGTIMGTEPDRLEAFMPVLVTGGLFLVFVSSIAAQLLRRGARKRTECLRRDFERLMGESLIGE